VLVMDQILAFHQAQREHRREVNALVSDEFQT
jgi:hypothetical protein